MVDIAAPNTPAEAITALGQNISEGMLRGQSEELITAVKDPNRYNKKRRA